MSGKDEIHFKCTIQGLHGEDPLRQDLDLTEKKFVPRRVFVAKIRSKYGVPGEITLHRSVKGKSGLVPGQEIRDDNLTLESNETIFVLYNKKVIVIAGGAGNGSEVVSRNNTLALAKAVSARAEEWMPTATRWEGTASGETPTGKTLKGKPERVTVALDPATAPRSSRIVVKK